MHTVWIIDDEPLVARTLERKLKRRGQYDVVFLDPRTDNVSEALRSDELPDVIVMDWNGHPVWEWIPLAGEIPVIIWTGAIGVTTDNIPGATKVRTGKHIRVVLDIEDVLGVK
jgi:DNA-binding response OmpR family regulator